jgi:hypothetical protein
LKKVTDLGISWLKIYSQTQRVFPIPGRLSSKLGTSKT